MVVKWDRCYKVPLMTQQHLVKCVVSSLAHISMEDRKTSPRGREAFRHERRLWLEAGVVITGGCFTLGTPHVKVVSASL